MRNEHFSKLFSWQFKISAEAEKVSSACQNLRQDWETENNQDAYTHVLYFLEMASREFKLPYYDPIRNEAEKKLMAFRQEFQRWYSEQVQHPPIGYVPNDLTEGS